MRESVKDSGRLQHMLEMAIMLEAKKSRYTLDDIKSDTILFYGLSKMVEIIGEAAYMITNEYKSIHTELPWRQIEGMRHILIHGYYTISSDVLWDVIQNDIPSLIPILECYIKDYK